MEQNPNNYQTPNTVPGGQQGVYVPPASYAAPTYTAPTYGAPVNPAPAQPQQPVANPVQQVPYTVSPNQPTANPAPTTQQMPYTPAPAATAPPTMGTAPNVTAYSYATPAGPSPEEKAKARKKKAITFISIATAVIAFIVGFSAASRSGSYNNAVEFYNNGQYSLATSEFYDLGNYKDSYEMYLKSLESQAIESVEKGEIQSAYNTLRDAISKNLENNSSSSSYSFLALQEICYNTANVLLEKEDGSSEEYYGAYKIFDLSSIYNDSLDLKQLAFYKYGVALYREGNWEKAYNDVFLTLDESYEDTELYVLLCWLEEQKDYDKNEDASIYYEVYQEYYNLLLPYAKTNEDALAALDSPAFYLTKFAGCVWKDGKYSINIYCTDTYWNIIQNVEWDTPKGSYWECFRTDDGLRFTIDGSKHWLTITGFSSAIDLHPEEVYITGNDGIEYTFKLSKVR